MQSIYINFCWQSENFSHDPPKLFIRKLEKIRYGSQILKLTQVIIEEGVGVVACLVHVSVALLIFNLISSLTGRNVVSGIPHMIWGSDNISVLLLALFTTLACLCGAVYTFKSFVR